MFNWKSQNQNVLYPGAVLFVLVRICIALTRPVILEKKNIMTTMTPVLP
jgi:hypothetical protein